MDQCCIPFDRCYWVVPGKLLAGAYPGSFDAFSTRVNLRGLLTCGIRRIISLVEAHEAQFYSRRFVNYENHLNRVAGELGVTASVVHIPVVDMDVPSRRTMIEILDEIDSAVSGDIPVYVHCWGGRGRTGTVVGCYLIRHGLAVGQGALEKIKELRRNDPGALLPSPESRMQREMVRSWKVGE